MICTVPIIRVMNKVLNVLKLVAISWITFAVTVSGGHGMVLCFGADGHFALKMSQHRHCEDTSDARGHGRHGAAEIFKNSSADCCSSCVDVPLSSDTMVLPMSDVRCSTSSAGRMTPVLSTASFDARDLSDRSLTARHALRCVRLRTSPFLLVLRTIVLRV